MFKNKLILLGLVTIVVIIAATIFVNLNAPQTAKEKISFFPKLAKQIENVNHISIKGYAESINLTLKDGVWGIDEFDGYPALPDKVKSAVLGAAELKINAPKTTKPRLYHRLGVEGPDVQDTTSLLLTLKDSDNKKIIDVIVGKPRRSSASQSSPGLYIRKPDDEQSWLVDGVLDITAVKTEWIERSLFDIPSEAIRSVRIDHADGDTYKLFKTEKGQENFEFENLPPGKKLGPEILINRFATILQDMQISGAKSRDKFAIKSDSTRVRIETFDYVLADMTAFEKDGIAYATFDFSFDDSQIVKDDDKNKTEDVKKFITDLNKRTAGWVFEIPSFKYDIVKKHSDRILRDNNQTFSNEETTE